MVKFLLGLLIGGLLGVALMCIFQVSGSDREEFEKKTERE